jgi:hypothetical protein
MTSPSGESFPLRHHYLLTGIDRRIGAPFSNAEKVATSVSRKCSDLMQQREAIWDTPMFDKLPASKHKLKAHCEGAAMGNRPWRYIALLLSGPAPLEVGYSQIFLEPNSLHREDLRLPHAVQVNLPSRSGCPPDLALLAPALQG